MQGAEVGLHLPDQLTNCELSALQLAVTPLGNRLSKDTAIPSVQPFIVLLACLEVCS